MCQNCIVNCRPILLLWVLSRPVRMFREPTPQCERKPKEIKRPMQSEIESKIIGVVVIAKRSVVISRARCWLLSPIACKSRNTESPRCNAHTRLEASTKQMLSSVVVSSRPEARQNNVQRRNISKTLNAPQSRISTFPESIGGVEERKSKSTQ